jgi:hypothetical protein
MDDGRFTAIDTFWSDELRMQFVAGMSYQPREGDDLLRSLIPGWIEQGKIREGGPQTILSGTGKVT